MNTDLLPRFLEYAAAHELFAPGDKILAATSGGADSMAMADLLLRTGQPFVIAHCNFNLRQEESERDESFVRRYCEDQGIVLKIKHFQTKQYASEHGHSIEMAARELRYDWFRQVSVEMGCTTIAVAHHSDDSIETSLINLIRGTGLRGLAGIHPKKGIVIRPLLFANRADIRSYLEFRNLAWCEDSSNQDISIMRNRIRHQLVPLLESMNPGFRSTFLNDQTYFQSAQMLIESFVSDHSNEMVTYEKDLIRINISAIKESPFPAVLLFEILRQYGFKGRIISSIIRAMEGIPGKWFTSKSHQLLVDREFLLISSIAKQTGYKLYLDPSDTDSFFEAGYQAIIHQDKPFHPSSDPDTAWLDFGKLEFPLLLRHWSQGDSFHPLGMDKSKKISDYFIDAKVNRIEKTRTPVMLSGGNIIWIPGHRIDHRYRITDQTLKALVITRIAP